jgi:hypothetical protein
MALLDFFTGENSAQDQADLDRTDAALAQLNAEKAARLREQGRQAEAEKYLAETQANLNRGKVANVEQDVNNAFYEGAAEGAANIRGSIGSVVAGALKAPFQLVPWWILLGAAVAAFIYFGGLRLIKRPA